MLAAFSSTLFLSSALLFLVEPMFAKMVLPLLGSAPGVWNTAVLFFQAALLAGYAYAHSSTGWLGARRQAILHCGLLLLPILVLHIAIPSGWTPGQGNPIGWLLVVLLVSVGLPFFVVSSTAPLLQRWFASTLHRAAADPYFLYGASNLGSAIALLGYPALIEPRLTLSAQVRLWSIGYGVFIALVVASAVVLWRSPARAILETKEDPPQTGQRDMTPGGRLRWVAMAFVPASLMLGVTSYLTTDLAPIPLIWIIPLSLYLFSFVLVFSTRGGRVRQLMGRALPILALPTVLTILLNGRKPLWVLVLLHVATFFVAAAVCHGQLARDRPPPRHLTEFYLWIAVGGVLGGAFNALVAPVVFNSLAEYPLALVLACLLRPRPAETPSGAGQLRLDLGAPIALAFLTIALGLAVRGVGINDELARRALVFGLPALACVALIDRPVRFGLAIAGMLLASAMPFLAQNRVIYSNRTFFGTHEVVVAGSEQFHLLMHGTTVHGAQSLDPAHRDDPLTYYARSGPLGQIIADYEEGQSSPAVGVIGLGTGSLACYARQGEQWDFYELDPDVARIARDPHLFTFLTDCAPSARVILGDGRLSISRAAAGHYGLIVIDAFNSDTIPTHLLTRQAIHLYLAKLAQGGIVAFNISNRYLNLRPVLADVAANAGLVSLWRDDSAIDPTEAASGKFASSWLVMARRIEDVDGLVSDHWERLHGRHGVRVWSDDYSNFLSVVDWG
jgi:hypothetical protein